VGSDTTTLNAKARNAAAIHQRLASRARLRTSAITNSSPLIISLYDFWKEAMRRTSTSSSASPCQRRPDSIARSFSASSR